MKTKTSRKITEIIIHCSATPEGRHVTVADIDRWHRQRGFSSIGYHFVIDLDGKIETGRPLEKIGAHCKNHNANSIGVCYVGGCDRQMRPKDTRTPLQRQALRKLVDNLLSQFPHASVHAHNEFAPKACPSFNIADL